MGGLYPSVYIVAMAAIGERPVLFSGLPAQQCNHYNTIYNTLVILFDPVLWGTPII